MGVIGDRGAHNGSRYSALHFHSYLKRLSHESMRFLAEARKRVRARKTGEEEKKGKKIEDRSGSWRLLLYLCP